ncbi:serine-arginine protein 55 isoform X1 [Eupeodes corollae]|uniref:serine-arginine protein 55 isoform X1 n=1 Tax=Eupeodes corollae TaxID=290404 RepID=UPI00249209D9|nr:serine-arginine protein 55 isoform X1 [Eupeodes corollae]XP_055908112.1 serine-arginine protein 55 isoform X1 [Eupeodes corollae]
MVGSRVYVGGLPYGVRERDLERFFKGYGRTRDILIKNGYGFVEFEDYRDADDAVYELNGKELLGERVVVEPARGTARGSHRDRYDDRYNSRRGGGGGGRYNDKRRGYNSRKSPGRDSDDGKKSRTDKSGDDPRSKNSRSSSRYGPPLRTEYRLIVENLSSRVSWQDLKDYMRQAGEVTYADAHKQRRNEGVVEFASLSDMKTAIEKLDDTDLNGRRVRLVEDRRGGRSGGRGRSRSSSSRSRSRSRRRSRSRSRRSSRSRSKSHSRSKSRGARSKSKSVVKSRSRSRSNKSRDVSKSKSKSRSRSRSLKRASSRSRSRSHSKRESRSRSRSKSRRDSHSRDRSGSENNKSRSRSISPKNGNMSPDRNNESMED